MLVVLNRIFLDNDIVFKLVVDDKLEKTSNLFSAPRLVTNESMAVDIKHFLELVPDQRKESKQSFWWRVWRIGFLKIFFN